MCDDYSDVVLVRFVGGSGGEAVCWFLHTILNGEETVDQDQTNRIVFQDFLRRMQKTVIRNDIVEQFGFSARRWEDITVEEMSRFVAVRYASARPIPYKIGKCHFFLKPEANSVFGNAVRIDLVPDVNGAWIPKTLHCCKTGFKKLYEPGTLDFAKDHPQYREALAFHAEHGWMPEYFITALTENYDLHYPLRFLDIGFGGPHLRDATLRLRSDLLVIDEDLGEFRRLAKHFEKEITPEIEAMLLGWVRKNRAIIEAMGLIDRVGTEYSVEEQKDFLRKVMAERGEQWMLSQK